MEDHESDDVEPEEGDESAAGIELVDSDIPETGLPTPDFGE